ncbi:MAG: error-prone DNA polymerase [Chloroflexi bacterium]|nr:error-prone DNA polymerase [Chloroflexota bacterium]RIK20098.1 MAG: error-prone DNA polymerase [Chloroflexota bacterium]
MTAEYVELHAHSCYSLLDGASFPAALVARAAALDMPGLALTDHDAVYGAVPFTKAAREVGIKPILGAELTVGADRQHLTMLVQNAAGWANLCALITAARHNAPKGEALLDPSQLAAHNDGLIVLSGCRRGEIATALRLGQRDAAVRAAHRCRSVYGARFYIELQRHHRPDDQRLTADLIALARDLKLPVVATNNVHYAERSGHRLNDILTCIRHNTTLDDACALLRPNSEYYLKPAAEMAALFADVPDALANTVRIAERCEFTPEFGLQELPEYPTPDDLSPGELLRALCRDGLAQRGLEPTGAVMRQMEHELAVITRSGLSNYFLIVWDIVRWSREHGILCQGRGSAANSLVAYLLLISPVNPLEHDLVFERFLSEERHVTPDIDIDFDAARREDVIQYVYQRYGHDHAAMACTFITFRARSAMRDIGKALGLPLDVLNRASRVIDTYRSSGRIAENGGLSDLIVPETLALIGDLAQQIDGFPRHLGIHNGGMILTGAPLSRRLPTEPATMPDRYVVQWDKDGLEDADICKIDILGLRMLSAVAEAAKTAGVDLDALTFDDATVYDMVTAADTIGVFQVESRAQAQVLPRLQPRQFNDLIISISLIRPGPIQGNMVHPYLRRRLGEEPVQYPHPRLEPALAETLGVVLFQEQVLKVARDLAGFTGGQGELLRRALGSKRAHEQIEKLHDSFIDGAAGLDVTNAVAESVFDALRSFGGYSFPKSHAAAFAVLVYKSAWLKRYRPAEFACALLNNQPMGFWAPAVIVNDARRHGVRVLPVDLRCSAAACTVEDGAVRLGFRQVRGIGEEAADRIVAARDGMPFAGLRDFCRRTRLPHRLTENLILAGAMDHFDGTRREQVWALANLLDAPGMLDLDMIGDPLQFPAASRGEIMAVEYDLTGVMLREHPLALYRDWLDELGVFSSAELADVPEDSRVRVAGLAVVHQAPPTAKGHHFITLEDEDGFINVVVRPKVYPKYRTLLRTSPLLVVEGEIQRQGAVVNVVLSDARTLGT